jgi:magnesium-transporting ATPase (P-type)
LVPATVDRKHDIPAEARNLVFMSSLAMNGEGRGIVIRTGEDFVLACTLLLRCCSLAGWLAGLCCLLFAAATLSNVCCCFFATGDETMIGKIASLASGTNTHRSTLQVKSSLCRL